MKFNYTISICQLVLRRGGERRGGGRVYLSIQEYLKEDDIYLKFGHFEERQADIVVYRGKLHFQKILRVKENIYWEC